MHQNVAQLNKRFKTIFIRYRAKNDVNLIKEISDMNLNLGDSGTELKANAKDI